MLCTARNVIQEFGARIAILTLFGPRNFLPQNRQFRLLPFQQPEAGLNRFLSRSETARLQRGPLHTLPKFLPGVMLSSDGLLFVRIMRRHSVAVNCEWLQPPTLSGQSGLGLSGRFTA